MIEQVVQAMREVAEEIIVPRFRNLAEGEIIEKNPGDLVTIADRESEVALTARLLDLLPGSLVVGEEAVAADPAVMERLADAGPVWLIDPIDGTGNFAAGHEPFGVMVALLRGGKPVLGAIYEPMSDKLSVAELGSGAWLNGMRMTADHHPVHTTRPSGTIFARYLPQPLRDQVLARMPRLGHTTSGVGCSCRIYPDLIEAEYDFAMFWRSLPWDHAAGALLIRESGGVSKHFDGTDYDPTKPEPGLLVCRDAAVFDLVRSALLE